MYYYFNRKMNVLLLHAALTRCNECSLVKIAFSKTELAMGMLPPYFSSNFTSSRKAIVDNAEVECQ